MSEIERPLSRTVKGRINSKRRELAARKMCFEMGLDADEMIKPLAGINAPAIEQWRLLSPPRAPLEQEEA
jgi:hypothetical protein